ncbi:oxygen-regulated invasion protein OrgB [Pseudomonas sp. R3-56]|uniref:oxygen-regulated invasion protein OrgB n=1 Tax=Pseudomonas sp. R3-56 TaxID=2817401 RepID=UPI003DA93863
MLDSIRTLTDLPASSDAYLAREDIVAARRRHALQREAQRRAREYIEQAHRDVEAVHAKAFQQGYAEGILRATGHLADALLEAQTLALQLREELARAAGEVLSQALSSPHWLDEMLERWLQAQLPDDSDAVLHLLLPLHCRSRGNELLGHLRERWSGRLSLEYHAQERYVLRLADQLLEFNVDAVRQRLEPRLLAKVANLPEAARALDQTSRQMLIDLCSIFAERPADSPRSAKSKVEHEN